MIPSSPLPNSPDLSLLPLPLPLLNTIPRTVFQGSQGARTEAQKCFDPSLVIVINSEAWQDVLLPRCNIARQATRGETCSPPPLNFLTLSIHLSILLQASFSFNPSLLSILPPKSFSLHPSLVCIHHLSVMWHPPIPSRKNAPTTERRVEASKSCPTTRKRGSDGTKQRRFPRTRGQGFSPRAGDR